MNLKTEQYNLPNLNKRQKLDSKKKKKKSLRDLWDYNKVYLVFLLLNSTGS